MRAKLAFLLSPLVTPSHRRTQDAMAAAPAAETLAAREAAGADLKFLMSRENVGQDFQDQLYVAGITSVKQFAALVKDAEELKKVIDEEFKVEGTGLARRVAISRIVVAWEAARARSSRVAELDAEYEAQNVPKRVGSNDFLSMKEAFEEKWWPLTAKKTPAKVYIERIAAGVEKGELRAEPLSEVVHYHEGDVDVLKAIWDPSGSIKAVKTTPTCALPRDPEELRARVTLLGTAWQMVAFQQAGNQKIAGLNPQLWQEYLEYLLGDYVYKLFAKDEFGRTVGGPSWSLILSYEHEIRREAVRATEKGKPYHQTLRAAWEDPVLKERFFTTPMALAPSRKRPLTEEPSGPGSEREGGPPRGKGKGKPKKGAKGDGKPTGKPKPGDCSARTPDGKLICYGFNDPSTNCDRKKCRFLHVCGRCFKDHPVFRCPETH